MQRRTDISGGITTRRSLGITLALTSAILFSTAGILPNRLLPIRFQSFSGGAFLAASPVSRCCS